MKIKNIHLYSLGALTIIAANAVFAEQPAYAPDLKGGVTGSIGTFYVVPSVSEQHLYNVDTDYDFGLDASIGYIFPNTANGIDLSYRGISTDDNASEMRPMGSFDDDNDIKYTQNAADLMISQYMDIGNHMQMRFTGGLAYVNLQQEQDFSHGDEFESNFTGYGPRLGIDARYDFGKGIGIVGGGSFAYFLGDMDVDYDTATTTTPIATEGNSDNNSVTNLRANLGLDFVHYFKNEQLSTLGLELGYQFDYYNDAIVALEGDTGALSFAGPYLLLKGIY